MTSCQGVTFRVRYADTDAMGVVYNAVYLVWFEAGRTEWMRDRGLPYRVVTERGISLPVTEAAIRFRAPARYDDLVTVKTALTELRSRKVMFSYRVLTQGHLLAEGTTQHVPVETVTGRSIRLPTWMTHLITISGSDDS